MVWDFKGMTEGMMAYAVASYAARTFPVPSNQYFRWLLGIVQYALSNPDLAKMKESTQVDPDRAAGEEKSKP